MATRSKSQFCCSFSSKSTAKCSEVGDEKNLVAVLSCSRDMSKHLRYINISEGVTEWKLLLNRAGFDEGSAAELTVCPLHRRKFSVDFFPSKHCAYPDHGGKKGKRLAAPKDCRTISLALLEEIRTERNVTLPIGSVVCTLCRKQLYSRRRAASSEGTAMESDVLVADLPRPPSPVQVPELPTCEGVSPQMMSSDGGSVDNVVTSTPWLGQHADVQLQFDSGSDITTGDDSPTHEGSFTAGARKRDEVRFASPLVSSDDSPPSKQPRLEFQPTSSESSSSDEREASVWFDRSMTQKDHRHALNTLLSGHGFKAIQSTLNTEWDDLGARQKNYYTMKIREGFEAVIRSIAPGQETRLFDITRSTGFLGTGSHSSSPDISNIDSLVPAYLDASSRARVQILSLFAHDFTKKELQQAIPGLTIHKIDQARNHSLHVGMGEEVPVKKITRARLDPDKTDHFIDFISQPRYLQDVAFGTKVLKMDSGDRIVVPGVIRTVIPARIIKQYEQYCEEIGFVGLSQSTLYRILEVCGASQQKSLQGLDYLSAEGADGFDTILNIVNSITTETVMDTTSLLSRVKYAKRYLKTEYAAHVASDSRCADHCMTYALSDPTSRDHSTPCSHAHDMECISCKDTVECLSEIKALIDAHSKNREADLHDFTHAADAVLDWKAHILRAANQGQAKNWCLTNLSTSSCLLIIDWAMKFLPLYYRERMTDFFGKRGKSWHMSCLITKDSDEQYCVTSYVHVFESVTQNWEVVCSIIEKTLSDFKTSHPDIVDAYIRSDNAGCYHNASLLAQLPGVSQRCGVNVKRYDFSETQSGKDVCDRKIAPLKRHVRLYVAEKNDVVSAADMKIAMESHGGVAGCSVSTCRLDGSGTAQGFSVPGISMLHNFSFEREGILRCWKAYEIGEGSVINLPPVVPDSEHHLKLTTVEEPTVELMSRPLAAGHEKSQLYVCSDERCCKFFSSQAELQAHEEEGWHESESSEDLTVYDGIRRKWALVISGVTANDDYTQRAKEVFGYSTLEEGWALKSVKRGPKMSEGVKNYLTKLFNDGEKSGQKVDPTQCVKLMRAKFPASEWRTAKQISSFFSRLTVQRKRKGVDEDEDDDANDRHIWQEEMRDAIFQEVGVVHPIMYGGENLCDMLREKELDKLKVVNLKEICKLLNIDSKLCKRKSDFVSTVTDYLEMCSCHANV